MYHLPNEIRHVKASCSKKSFVILVWNLSVNHVRNIYREYQFVDYFITKKKDPFAFITLIKSKLKIFTFKLNFNMNNILPRS